jgi:acetate kinase
MKILVLNAGSSSQKSRLYEIEADSLSEQPVTPIWEAETDNAKLKVITSTGATLEVALPIESTDGISHLLQTLWSGPTQVINSPKEIGRVGHRVVHGGLDFQRPTLITDEVKATIERLSLLAPAHNPAALKGIEAVSQLFGDVPQIAVFDTAFHSSLPETAAIYPIPYKWAEQGIRRYGFHGINHQYCAGRAAQILGKDLKSLRIISCHLGNGCSLAAIREGQSIDTTMGFTTLEGLMMGTRCGSIDPGILLYLQREKGYNADELDHILNKESGLKGVSGLSGDMRQITAAIAQGNQRVKLAFDIYVHRLRSAIGAMLPPLGGLDALIFTAGVGENSAAVRASVCDAFGFLGLSLSADKNEGKPIDEDISSPESAVRVLVIQAQEDWAIAQQCFRMYHAGSVV